MIALARKGHLRLPAPVTCDIRSQLREELEARFKDWGAPAYRLTQLLEWLYVHRATGWDQMTNIPKALRQQLAGEFSLHELTLARQQGARDTTRKFLWQLADGAFIESVLIPANPALYSEASDRQTLCVSTQVGCAYGCRFCASGLEGWKRNLGVDEIVGQILAVERLAAAEAGGSSAPGNSRAVTNLVFMGMGEPLANYNNLLKALRILNAPWGCGIGARKITISTSGLAPQIRRLAEEPEQFQLAISLHGATDEVRNRIMPVNRKYPLNELAAAAEQYQKRKGRMITLEYILIEGVNDHLDQTAPLAKLAQRLHAKVNLIPYNKVEGLEWRRPAEEHCIAFAERLRQNGVTATLRLEKGHDIDAACGQLRLKTEKELAAQPAST
ncbi:MAG TPA: 23S rRNA (adenine(2503)-C(2))-methyltransferase RlmN [Verrucomicrobiales bacterium]|nr:23S rRNA (adenine(2503)-C(2))-methyltransferase RlmN [Verrucomicrobiales bacterium]